MKEIVVREVNPSEGVYIYQILADEDSDLDRAESIRILKAALADIEGR